MINFTVDGDDEIESLLSLYKARGISLELNRMQAALKNLGNPYNEIPAIQVIGTNGKGSIVSFLESCLKEARIKIGCSTSPHLVSWRERIRINGQEISSQDFLKILTKFQAIAKSYRLTPFELIILSAFDYFYSNQVELMVLEVGLGGKLDATTAHPFRPLIAIGGIGLDHCEYLGNTLTAITKEKTAVISYGSTVISSPQEPEVKRVIEKVVSKNNARIIWVEPLSKDWELGIAGEIQRTNAAVAKGILEALPSFGWEVNQTTIRRGLSLAKWPGRLQKASWGNMQLILDGAHNEHAANQLAKERLLWPSESNGIFWIFGIQAHKDGPEIIRKLLKVNDLGWVVPVPNTKSWSKSNLCKTYPEMSNQLNEANSVAKVLEKFSSGEMCKDKKTIVITGSLLLIGNLLRKDLLLF